MEADEARSQSNSEMRFIALELMKLSLRRKVPFRKLALQYVRNVYALEGMIRAPLDARARSSSGVGAKARR